jgi:hypothetical protein
MWGLEGGKNPGVDMTRIRFSAGGGRGVGVRLSTYPGRRKSMLAIGLRHPASTLCGLAPREMPGSHAIFPAFRLGMHCPLSTATPGKVTPPGRCVVGLPLAYRLAFTSWRSFHRATIRTLRGSPATRGRSVL